jgi:diguanylate cyclase (GGDEF)-like protein
MTSRAVITGGGEGAPTRLYGVHLDITQHKEAEQRIWQVSQHDPLTGLPNRALIHGFAEPMLAAARRSGALVAVLFVDMDRFKPINDEHGHAVGDEVLKEIARRLRTSVRESDLVGRLGGDEFLLVLNDVRSTDSAMRVARVCISRLGQPYRIDSLELRTTPSIGISLFPQHGRDIDALIRHADAAMYEAKQQVRNRFQFYQPELREKAE